MVRYKLWKWSTSVPFLEVEILPHLNLLGVALHKLPGPETGFLLKMEAGILGGLNSVPTTNCWLWCNLLLAEYPVSQETWLKMEAWILVWILLHKNCNFYNGKFAHCCPPDFPQLYVYGLLICTEFRIEPLRCQQTPWVPLSIGNALTCLCSSVS